MTFKWFIWSDYLTKGTVIECYVPDTTESGIQCYQDPSVVELYNACINYERKAPDTSKQNSELILSAWILTMF